MFVTLVRFDPVYHGHFKCNPGSSTTLSSRGIFGICSSHPGIEETVNFDQIKRHYYGTHEDLNPGGIVPVGPELDLTAPHHRESLGAQAPGPEPEVSNR